LSGEKSISGTPHLYPPGLPDSRGGVAALLSILPCAIATALGESTHSFNQATQIKIRAQQGNTLKIDDGKPAA
jgi:hypothetical protein